MSNSPSTRYDFHDFLFRVFVVLFYQQSVGGRGAGEAQRLLHSHDCFSLLLGFSLPLSINVRILIRLSKSILMISEELLIPNRLGCEECCFDYFFVQSLITLWKIQFLPSLEIRTGKKAENILIFGEIMLSDNKILLYCTLRYTQHFRLGGNIEINNHEIHHIKLPQLCWLALFFPALIKRIFFYSLYSAIFPMLSIFSSARF